MGTTAGRQLFSTALKSLRTFYCAIVFPNAARQRVCLQLSAAALKQLEVSEQFSNELVSHFHEEFTRTGRSRKKSRKQQEAEREAVFG
jgi:hypothetical protein